MKALVFSFVLGATLLALPQQADAQPDTAADNGTVRADYRKALAEMDKGNWQNARALLIDLFKRSPTFDVAASLGEAEARLGESASAAQHFAYALKNVPPKEKADTSARIRGGLNSVLGNVATVHLSVNRKDVPVYLDGALLGTYPALAEVYLSPGKHTIEARDGDAVAKKEVQATAGSNSSLAIELKANAPAVSSGLAAPNPSPAQPKVAPPVEDEPDTVRSIVLVTGGSLAVAGLAVGIGFGLASNAAESDANSYRALLPKNGCASGTTGDCKSLDDALSRQKNDSTIANVGWVLGGVGLVAVGAALLWPRGDAQKDSAAASWSLDVQGNGLRLRGSF